METKSPGAPWLERHVEQRLSSLSFGGPGEAEVRKVSWGHRRHRTWRGLGGAALRGLAHLETLRRSPEVIGTLSCQPALDRAALRVPRKPNLLPRGEAFGTCDSRPTGKGGEKGCLTGCWEQRASGETRARNEWRRSDLANLLFFISTSRQNAPQN